MNENHKIETALAAASFPIGLGFSVGEPSRARKGRLANLGEVAQLGGERGEALALGHGSK
jgi:hypothetical protein